MKSLRTKLLLVVLPVLVIALVLVAIINHNKAKEFLELEFAEKTEISLESARNDINNFFSQKVSEVELIANTELVQTMNPTTVVPYIAREIGRLNGFDSLGIVSLDGVAYVDSGGEVDVKDRQYYIDTVAREETVLSEPLISRATEEMIIVVSTPIYSNGIFSGVFIATVPIADIQTLVGEFTIGQDGFAFLVDERGTVIAHPDESVIMDVNLLESENSELRGIVSNVLDNETGTAVYKDNQVESYAFYTMIPLTKWGFVISAPVKEITGNLSYLAMLSFVTAAVVLLFSIIIVFIFARSLVSPIQKLSDLTSQVALGDLTVSSSSQSKDEVGILSNNFDKMVKKIQELLYKIDNVSSTVKDSSDTLIRSSSETKEASQQVAVTISELAQGTTDIADSVTNTTSRMNTMIDTVKKISNYTNEVIDTSTNSKSSAEKGLQSAQYALEKMNDVDMTVKETSVTIGRLDNQSKEIGHIIGMITSIAEQTNLLALNASIEAARAGEHGKGFAVVADEVRKLASETSESADKISRLIKDTQTESQRAVNSIQKGEGVVKEGTETVQKASQAFTEIAAYVDEVLERNKSIFESVQDLERIGEEIGRNMESISAVTQQASAGAEEVSATTDQQASSANQIANDAQNLAKLAVELREVMTMFKTGK
nr:methyl-accepting chemotaxis protein [Bacillus sp. FJAT-45350]